PQRLGCRRHHRALHLARVADGSRAIVSRRAERPLSRHDQRDRGACRLLADRPLSLASRGIAPAGYIKGMAVTFALVCQKWRAGDSAALAMAAPNSGDDDGDALSWYDAEFQALGMSNAVPGLNTASPVRAFARAGNARE